MLYSRVWESQSDEEKAIKIAALAELLHCPKPAGIHVLKCIGVVPPTAEFIHQGFAFVYAIPANAQESIYQMPCTLLQILQAKKHLPLLEEKFKIARYLTSSVFEWHSAGWLHKNISSSNLMFFEGSVKNAGAALKSDPYLIGFHHSRPDGEIWFSSARLEARTPYHHPRYMATWCQKVFDYYSVGVVLLEIGFWEPISAFRMRHADESDDNFQTLLIESYAPRLGPKMGSLYRDVFISCLSGTFEGTNTEPDTRQDEVLFYWAVVAPLKCCKLTAF